MKPTQSTHTNSYIFQVELLIEGEGNGEALEKLIKSLNQGEFTDYRILNGIQLGQLIDQRKSELPGKKPVQIPATTKPAAPSPSNGLDPIRAFMKSNKLIRLIVNKGLGIKLSIPCRIINIDEEQYLITVYHVDEKQVYTFRLNEIEDFQE